MATDPHKDDEMRKKAYMAKFGSFTYKVDALAKKMENIMYKAIIESAMQQVQKPIEPKVEIIELIN